MGLLPIPNSLWDWMDKDVYGYLGLKHAMVCHRPAWLYQKLWSTAPLHGLVKEMFPNSLCFWATWAFAPQFIGMKILNQHFTAHTWLNWAYTLDASSDAMQMILAPRSHTIALPLRASSLVFSWGVRALTLKLFGEDTIKTFAKYLGYVYLVATPMIIASRAKFFVAWCKLISKGELPSNPLQWEKAILAETKPWM